MWSPLSGGDAPVTNAQSAPLVVQKYGGTSVATPERVCAIADRVSRAVPEAAGLVVVLSAMGKSTDELVALAHQVSRRPQGREMDLLLATGEQVSVSLLGLALQDKGVPAVSLTATQCGIRTDGAFNIARIQSIDTTRIRAELAAGRAVIITGFQGVTHDHDVTTLGRGGSDITGAAVAAAIGADVCEICTDVNGVLSADPSVVPGATRWPEISYEEAIEMAASGAKVVHPRAVEVCMAYGIPIHVRSSFHMRPGTWIRGGEEMVMEQAAVVGVSSDKKITKITLLDVPDRPGLAAQVFQELATEDISVRLIIQSASSEGRGRITFVLDEEVRGSRPSPDCPLEGRGCRQGGNHRTQRGQDLDRRVTAGIDTRPCGPDVFGARARGDQHRLHQLVRDEDRVRHRGQARRPRGPGRARRVLS